jgi:hypothetical protein
LIVSGSRAGEADLVVQAGMRFLPLPYRRLVQGFAGDLGWRSAGGLVGP